MVKHADIDAAKVKMQKQLRASSYGTASMTGAREPGPLSLCDEMVCHRHNRDDTRVPVMRNFLKWRSQKTLGIGLGMSCDIVHMAKVGTIAYGIGTTQRRPDIEKSHEVLNGDDAEFELFQSAAIDYSDASLDLVCPLGRRHHTNDTVRSVSETYRVHKVEIPAAYRHRKLPTLGTHTFSAQ